MLLKKVKKVKKILSSEKKKFDELFSTLKNDFSLEVILINGLYSLGDIMFSLKNSQYSLKAKLCSEAPLKSLFRHWYSQTRVNKN